MKKVEKTTRPFRYDINQIPNNYTVEVRNRFKGLDLVDSVPDELGTEVRDIVQETGINTIPMEKKCKKAKWLSEEALQIAVKRREAKIGAGGVHTAKASRGESSFRGKGSAPGCIPKLVLPRPD